MKVMVLSRLAPLELKQREIRGAKVLAIR